jgi:protocatechuate 3,4-dioxygenase beta subunit
LPGIAGAQELPPTPECRDAHDATPRQTEGPFFKPKSPQRVDLIETATKGRPLQLSGLVLTRTCQPVSGALVDLWHADENGDYDNRGFRYRGHLFTDAAGRYRFRTIQPALYPGRARHYHVKVQAPNRPILTTQLYFPGDPQNERDGLFRRDLLMRVATAGEGMTGRFDFILDMG